MMIERHLPDRRKHGYKELEAKLNKDVQAINNRLAHWFKIGLGIIAFIGLATALAIFGFGVILAEQGDQQEQIQNQQDRIVRLATANRQLSLDIQQQRKDAIRDVCEETNQRHDETSESLIKAAAEDQKNAPNEAAREEIRRRRDVTLGLIDLISPLQDCEARVEEAVKPVEPVNEEP